MAAAKKLTFTNVEFQVPWGHIAGKIWGDPSSQRILAIHGLQDNCGVFDRLISLLRGDYYIVAIDLPGHGHSSHFPAGVPIEFFNFILAIVYVVKELGWKRFSYVGHSLGGQIGLFFVAMFPEYVEKLIVIDHVTPTFYENDNLVAVCRKLLDRFMALQSRQEKGTPPVYTYEQALDKLVNRDSTLTEEAAKIVLERSLKDVGDGVTFRMDQRLKQGRFMVTSIHLLQDVMQNVKCPTLFIFSTERYTYYRQIFGPIFKMVLEKRHFTVNVVAGNHDLHQNHPERIFEMVDQFFCLSTSKL